MLTCLPIFTAGCDSKPKMAPGQVRTAPVMIGQMEFQLEIADSMASRQRGLMHRQSMPADRGMLFVFDYPEVLRFWMKNTYIPLDIIYLDGAGKVVTIKQLKPLDETSVSSEKPAKYAIELNAGMAEKAAVREGDVIHLPEE
jgi:uncharacterized membrane protein (UPF0127 family)